MWYYGQEKNNLNGSARTVLHMLLSIMFCCAQRERMGGIQEFQFMGLNLENEGKIQGKEIERNMLAHRWCLIYATMSIVFMSEMVLSHLSSMVESSSSPNNRPSFSASDADKFLIVYASSRGKNWLLVSFEQRTRVRTLWPSLVMSSKSLLQAFQYLDRQRHLSSEHKDLPCGAWIWAPRAFRGDPHTDWSNFRKFVKSLITD